MSNKRERRLRRKLARKALAAQPSMQQQLAEALKLRDVALSAIAYIAEIDAPNLAQPMAIAHKRDELKVVVHQFTGRKPERRSHGVSNVQGNGHVSAGCVSEARVAEVRLRADQQPATAEGGRPGVSEGAREAAARLRGRVGAAGAAASGGGVTNTNTWTNPFNHPKARRDFALRDLASARRTHRLAAQRFGAVANSNSGSRSKNYTALAEHMESAARALIAAEQRLADRERELKALEADDVRAEAV